MLSVCIDDGVRREEDNGAEAEIVTVITLAGRAKAMTGIEETKLLEKKNTTSMVGRTIPSEGFSFKIQKN